MKEEEHPLLLLSIDLSRNIFSWQCYNYNHCFFLWDSSHTFIFFSLLPLLFLFGYIYKLRWPIFHLIPTPLHVTFLDFNLIASLDQNGGCQPSLIWTMLTSSKPMLMSCHVILDVNIPIITLLIVHMGWLSFLLFQHMPLYYSSSKLTILRVS
jgi:hypothetical protein